MISFLIKEKKKKTNAIIKRKMKEIMIASSFSFFFFKKERKGSRFQTFKKRKREPKWALNRRLKRKRSRSQMLSSFVWNLRRTFPFQEFIDEPKKKRRNGSSNSWKHSFDERKKYCDRPAGHNWSHFFSFISEGMIPASIVFFLTSNGHNY